MAERDDKAVRVQVGSAKLQDVGKGVARISEDAMTTIGVRAGDVIEIIGKRHTAALAVPPSPEDEGLDLIRLDGLQRANAAVGSGDHVEVKRADVKPAQRLSVAPAQNLALGREFSRK